MNEVYKNPDASQNNEYPLTMGQKGLWLLHQMDPLSDRYNIPLTFTFSDDVSSKTLQEILTLFVNRHEIMSSTFHETADQPMRKVNDSKQVIITEHNIDHIDIENVPKKIRSISSKPFDLETGPLIRVDVLNGYNGKRVLLLCIHHIIFDGASLKILFNELELIYQSMSNQKTLPMIDYNYSDFYQWQQQWLESDEANENRSFWLKKLSGDLPQLSLPCDRYSNHKSIVGDIQKFELDKSVIATFKKIAQKNQCSEYFIWLIAYSAFLSRYTQDQDIIVGSPVMARPEAQFDQVIGYFVNMIPLRLDIDSSNNMNGLIKQNKSKLYESLTHCDYPLAQMIQDLSDGQNRGDQPLFQTCFIWNATEHLVEQNNSALRLNYLSLLSESGEQDISLEMLTAGEEMHGVIKYRTHLFDIKTIKRIRDSFLTFVADICDHPDRSIAELSLINVEEKKLLFNSMKPTMQSDHFEPYIHQILEKQACTNPDLIALEYNDSQLSYQQLNSKANQLAYFLKQLPMGNKDIIGLCFERSIESIVALLAILKTGSAYVPLDPRLPEQRLLYICNDSSISHILTHEKAIEYVRELPVHPVVIDACEITTIVINNPSDNLTIDKYDDQLAYVMYTSGSTGQPKGVLQNHQTIINLVYAQSELGGPQTPYRTLQFAPITFDVSIQEMVTSWFTASTLVMINEKQKNDLNGFLELIKRLGIERLFVPPAIINWLAQQSIEDDIALNDLKEIIVAGEALSVSSELKRFFLNNPTCQLWNHYGPTETHVASIAKINVTDEKSTVPIGQIVPNLSAYIVDKKMQLVPYGATGELYIGGKGVAQGYLNNEELTETQFIKNIFSNDSEIIYKTGDLVRYLNDGQLTFMGRIDDQVKIRGFRIELGEIQHNINQMPDIETSIVTVMGHNNEDKHIVAYVIVCEGVDLKNEQQFFNKIRTHLSQYLPAYMLPSLFMLMDTLPLMENGKLDKKRLPQPVFDNLTQEYVKPEGEVAQHLATIWAEVLSLAADEISATANFFELGGHSLLVAKLINHIDSGLNVKLNYQDVFDHTILNDLSLLIENNLQTEALLQSFDVINNDNIEELEW